MLLSSFLCVSLRAAVRQPKTPIPPSCQFTEEEGVKLEDGRAPVCYFCKRDVDDAKAVQGEFIRVSQRDTRWRGQLRSDQKQTCDLLRRATFVGGLLCLSRCWPW